MQHIGLIAPYDAKDDWMCPECLKNGTSWVAKFTGRTTVLDAESNGLYCSDHPNSQVMSGARPVTVDDLGAVQSVVYENGVAVEKLYVWSDVDRGARLIQKSSSPSALQLWYLQAGGPLIELRGKTLSLADVQTVSTPVPRGESRFNHTIPIASQYLHLVNEEPIWKDGEGCWEIWLKGRPSPTTSTAPVEPAAANDGAVVWPREESAIAGKGNWRRQIVGASFQFSDVVAIVTSRPHPGSSGDAFEVGPFEKLPFVGAATEGTHVRYMVLAKEGRRDFVERGAIPIRPPRGVATDGARMGWIALDFGTANTTVIYSLESPTSPVSLSDGVGVPIEACFFPVHGSGFDKQMVDTLSLFSAWYAPEDGPKPMQTTLLLKKDAARHSVVPSNLLKHIKSAQGQLLGNLKWQGLDSFDGSSVEAYLERVLLPAFQAISSKGATRYRFVATYPLAFGTERKLRFESALANVLKTIGTGTQLTQEGFQMVSESHAGAHGVATLQAPYSLTIDMGGGTTDFALIKTDGSEVLMAESLRIGGRDLIRAALLDQQDVERKVAQACGASTDALSVRPEVAIEGLLGAKDGEVRLLMGQPGVARRQRIAALLSGILVATARLVSAALSSDGTRDRPPTINVVLLGQGWHLLHGELLPQPFTESFFLDCLDKSNPMIDFERVAGTPPSTERKLQLVRGALKVAASGKNVDALTTGMSFVGMVLNLADGKQLQTFTPLTGVPATAYADKDPGISDLIVDLVTTMQFFNSDRATIGDVNARLDQPEHNMSTRERLIREGNRDLRACRDDKSEIVRSPLMAVIETTWLEFWSPRVG